MTTTRKPKHPGPDLIRHARTGVPVSCQANVLAVLGDAPEFRDGFRYNTFNHEVEVVRRMPWPRGELAGDFRFWDAGEFVWLEQHLTNTWAVRLTDGLRAQLPNLLVAVAQRNAIVHPVAKHLRLLVWDGRPRVDTWLATYTEATSQPAEYLRRVGRWFLVSAVARALGTATPQSASYHEGVKADCLLVLEGDQGAGKSRAARALSCFPHWFSDGLEKMHGRDAAIHLAGKWIIELGELAAMRGHATQEQLKAFLSRQVDIFRPLYLNSTVRRPRGCVLIGTCNPPFDYLRDPSGARRFWPVRVGRVDVTAIERDRDQLWAEAVAALDKGAKWWPSTQEDVELCRVEQEQRRPGSSVEAAVQVYLADQGESVLYVKLLAAVAVHLEPSKASSHASAMGPWFYDFERQYGQEIRGVLGRMGYHKAGRARCGNGDRSIVYARAARPITFQE